MPASVDQPDSSVVRSPIHNTIGESTIAAASDDTDDEVSVYPWYISF